MRQSVRAVLFAAALVLASGVGRAEEPPKTLKAQETCPVMGGRVNENAYVDYQGKRIYVCCASCLKELQADPEKYLKKLEAMGEQAQPIPADESAAPQPGAPAPPAAPAAETAPVPAAPAR